MPEQLDSYASRYSTWELQAFGEFILCGAIHRAQLLSLPGCLNRSLAEL